MFYSHVNFSVTKIFDGSSATGFLFYSHVNFSVTKIVHPTTLNSMCFTVT